MKTTFILGAGFSKAAGIPIQAELAEQMLSVRFDSPLDKVITKAITEYLSEVFGYQTGAEFPSMEDMFTVIDLSSMAGLNLGIKYSPRKLRALRRMLKYRIFTILEQPFSTIDAINKLLHPYIQSGDEVSFVVLNWDLVLEKHLLSLNPHLNINYSFPCYDWNNPTSDYDHHKKAISVLKIHGSVNWVYCDNCKSLFYDLTQNLHLKTKAGLYKEDFYLFDKEFTDKEFDAAMESAPDDRVCKFCGETVSSHIATFSFRKSFRTHAYPAIWYKAERVLSDADKWVFIGYSLPDADFEFKHMLKTAQYRMSHKMLAKAIDVVIRPSEIIAQRFQTFFGCDNVRIFADGLEGYVV
jgi:hypothetical protein